MLLLIASCLLPKLFLVELSDDHIRIGLLLQLLFVLLILLVPSPLVHLRLSEPCHFGHSDTGLLSPVWILKVLLLKVLHLARVLPIPLFAFS